MAASGKPGRTWRQFVMLEPGSQMARNSGNVRQSTKSLAAFTTTVIASAATGSSITAIPARAQAASSLGRTTRLASATSTSPAQSFESPPPVPEKATATGERVSMVNSSAMASEMGYTVEEPSTRIIPCAAARPARASAATRAFGPLTTSTSRGERSRHTSSPGHAPPSRR